MAETVDIDETDDVFVGTAKSLQFTLYSDDAHTTPIDATGATLVWRVRKHDAHATALIEKSTADSPPGITLTGTFNVDPDVNTQRVVVALAATDTSDATVSPVVAVKAGTYRHSLARTDTPNETVYLAGHLVLRGATTP